GEARSTFADDLVGLIGEVDRTPLVFVSACRTAAQLDAATGSAGAAESLACALVRARVQNVMGWVGAVHGTDALPFAQTFYEEVARCRPVALAVALARKKLFEVHDGDPRLCQCWHLARLYVGSRGGGRLAQADKPVRATKRLRGGIDLSPALR